MNRTLFALAACGLALSGCAGVADSADIAAVSESTTDRNKRLAREFYENLWFTDNTSAYSDYVADEYIIHDLGDTKGAGPIEPAIIQQQIADRLHSYGEMTGEIDYQIAEGDMVATRWFIYLDPTEEAEAMGFTQVDGVPIINVFRFNDAGKIVEIWNHRHDVSLPLPPSGRPSSDQ